MPEPSISVIGNKADEMGALDQGADFEGVNRSDMPAEVEPITVTAHLGENDITIIPEKPFEAITELVDPPSEIIKAQIFDDPQMSPPTQRELMQQFKVAIKSMDRLMAVTTRNPRESLVWFRMQPTMDVAVTADRIVVIQDVTECVYSCQVCKGTAHSEVICGACGGEGVNCRHCMIVPFGHETPYSSGFKPCEACNIRKQVGENEFITFSNGWARGIVIPDSAQSLPVTGIVVSVGPDTCLTKLGDRVQFSRYAGHHTQMRGGRTFITMRESEVLCLMREAKQ